MAHHPDDENGHWYHRKKEHKKAGVEENGPNDQTKRLQRPVNLKILNSLPSSTESNRCNQLLDSFVLSSFPILSPSNNQEQKNKKKKTPIPIPLFLSDPFNAGYPPNAVWCLCEVSMLVW